MVYITVIAIDVVVSNINMKNEKMNKNLQKLREFISYFSSIIIILPMLPFAKKYFFFCTLLFLLIRITFPEPKFRRSRSYYAISIFAAIISFVSIVATSDTVIAFFILAITYVFLVVKYRVAEVQN